MDPINTTPSRAGGSRSGRKRWGRWALAALGGNAPILAFNTLQSKTERTEHMGLMYLAKGLFGAFRNVTAHAPKIQWPITEQDALELMALASLIHRRLDKAVKTGRETSHRPAPDGAAKHG
jgi:uncharacterized protein (TIGR02391 family)